MKKNKKNFDCIIIGCGIAGLTAGIACASAGLHTLILSGGMNALHFSSGSIDIYGHDKDKQTIISPFEYIEKKFSNKNNFYLH